MLVKLNRNFLALQEHAKSERIQNEILDVPASQLRNLSPEQHCHIQHHWLPPETVSIALEALDAWLDSEDGGELIGEQFVEDSQAQKQLVAASWHSEVLSTAFLHHVPYPIVRYILIFHIWFLRL
jgi:hypothetical protein